MPGLIVSVNHRLSQDEALRRILAAVAQAKTQYSDKFDDLRDSWNGYVGDFQISARNQQVSGTVTVNPADVTVQTRVKIPVKLLFLRISLILQKGNMRKKGLEPLRPYGHQLLRLARLPIPPLPRWGTV
jgi:hypothetical protein